MRVALEASKSSVVAASVGQTSSRNNLGILNAMGVMGSQDGGKRRWGHLSTKGRHGLHDGQWSQGMVRIIWLQKTNGSYLISVPRSEIHRKLSKFLLDLYKRESSMLSEQKSHLGNKNKIMAPQSFPGAELVCRLRTP